MQPLFSIMARKDLIPDDRKASHRGTYFRVRRRVRLWVRGLSAVGFPLVSRVVSTSSSIPPLDTIRILTALTRQIFAASARRDKWPSACAAEVIARLPRMIRKTLAQECGWEYLCLESRER
jgi:hypothetical protein